MAEERLERTRPLRLYLVAGEASGDLHGGKLAEALATRIPGVQMRAWGGQHLRDAGAEVVKSLEELAFMGFIEVVKHLGQIRANFQFAHADITAFQPDALILIDYPGFNLRLAKWANAQGIRVLYYISPQLWAWKEKRVEQVKHCVERMYCILPFEKRWYAERGVEVEYVGHPLLDRITPPTAPAQNTGSRILALLPGSRSQEIELVLPAMLEASKSLPDAQIVVAGAPGQPIGRYEALLSSYPNAELWTGRTYELLGKARAALVASGTATLETALHRVPQVVVYRGGALTYALAKRMIKVPYISLVNLVAQKALVQECIQHQASPAHLAAALRPMWEQGEARMRVLEGYEALHEALGGPGASQRTAESIAARLGC